MLNKISLIVEHIMDLNNFENKINLLINNVNKLNINNSFKKYESQIIYQELNEIEPVAFSNELREVFENHFLQIESLISIYNSLPNLKHLPPTRGWAGSPDFLNKIVEIIFNHKPSNVLEVSSGVSSVIIGLALKMNRLGKVLSFEHDSTYAEKTRKNIEINNIDDISNILESPLRDYIIDGESWKWYDFKELTFTENIDLLIIDGPPRTTQNLARYPAIPLLHKYFSENVIVLLDDANRYDEKIIVDKWISFLTKEGYVINTEYYPNYEKGMVLLNINRKK